MESHHIDGIMLRLLRKAAGITYSGVWGLKRNDLINGVGRLGFGALGRLVCILTACNALLANGSYLSV